MKMYTLMHRLHVLSALTALFFVSLASAQPANPTGHDYIVAVVNAVPITNHEVVTFAQELRAQYKQKNQLPLQGPALLKASLEQLIVDKALLQHAKETGVEVDELALDQAEQRAAAQRQLTVPEFRKLLNAQGVTPQRLRENLRDQVTLQRLKERNVPPRIKVSDSEIDQAIRARQSASIQINPDIELGHVLIAVPEKASPTQMAELKIKAQSARTLLEQGADLARVAKDLSNGPERDKGGLMGLRPASRYPTLFVDAVRNLAPGGVTLIQSAAGFHVLKLITKRASETLTITQTHARHILLRPGGQLSQNAARARLTEYKHLIEAGKADFAKLAREHSQDASAPSGGDLGWVSPGMFVPEFEEVMNQLQLDQIGDPLVSRFGVHLIQVLERREAPISERELREMIRSNLREKKFDETYQLWAQEVRGRAYVEYRDAPQ